MEQAALLLIIAFSDIEKPFLFSDLAALMTLKLPNQKIKKLFSVREGLDYNDALSYMEYNVISEVLNM